MKLYQKMLLALLLAGCAHKTQIPADYQQKLYEKYSADYQVESQTVREPSSEAALQTLKVQLGDLNKLKPGKFEIYVFPKMNQMNSKEIASDDTVLLGKPIVNEVSVIAVNDCKFFLVQGGFAKTGAKNYFPATLAQSKKKCAIVEVTSKSIRNLNKSLLRTGDELRKRLFLDDSYLVYGLETDYYSRDEKQSNLNQKTVGMKFPSGSATTSGMGFIPVDMPVLQNISSTEVVEANTVFADVKRKNVADFTFKSDGAVVDALAIRQISRLNKQFKTPQCGLRKFTYKDYYRKKVEMYWCEGMPWPQVVENNQFVAVTQNLLVR
jgi:hypothetical protein